MSKAILAALLAPVLNELEMRRGDVGEPGEDGRVEFLMRRMAAKMMGVDFSNLGLALDDLRRERYMRAVCEEPRMGDAEAVGYAVDRLCAWERA